MSGRPGTCKACGTTYGNELPNSENCCNCPPTVCKECGDMTHMELLCRCWVRATDMSVADLKAVFANNDLSADINVSD